MITLAIGGERFAQEELSADSHPVDLNSCRRIDAPRELSWPTSAIWRGEQIVFADVLEKALLTVDSYSGGSVGLRRDLNGASPLDLSQIRALPDGSGFLVEDEGGPDGVGDRLFRLDSDMVVVSTIAIQGRELSDGWVLDVVYDWQPAIIDGVVGVLAFGDFRHGRNWDSGLVYFDESESASIFMRLPVDSDAGYQHTQSTDYIAVDGSTGFMLVYETEPYLIQVDLSSGEQFTAAPPEHLEIPSDLRTRPAVMQHTRWQQADRGPEKLTAHLEIMEEASGATAIFTHDGQLFLVGRKADDEGTLWELTEISKGGAEIARSAIPVARDAFHLTLAVGPDSVGFLEKGRVQRIGPGRWNAPYLKMNQIVVMPSDWFDDLGNDALAQAVVKGCR